MLEKDFQAKVYVNKGKVCSVDGCGQDAFCKGMCKSIEEAIIGRDNKLKEWRLV